MEWFQADPARWAATQFGDAQLGDERRTKRLVYLAKQVVANPSGSLPDITECWADLKAAYRLFDEEDVTFKRVATPHWHRTRCCPPGFYLVLGDTTEFDWGEAAEGLGPTGNGGGRGFLLHSGLMARAESEEVMGLAGQEIHYRKPVPKGETRTERLARERESDLWGKVIDQVGRPPQGAQWVHVLDRGADHFEVYCHCLEQQTDWVVRAKSLHRKMLDPAGREVAVAKYLERLPEAGTFELKLRARPKQPARTAKLAVSFGPLRMLPPKLKSPYLKRLHAASIVMWVVHVREINVPRGVEPIEWVLYTSLPVQTFEQAMKVIGYYEKRWLIEEWHKALKTGCQVEARQLEHHERLEAMLGLMSVVAVRLLQLKGVARSDPNRPAGELIPHAYSRLLERMRKMVAGTIQTVGQFFRALAKLGGFLGRKGDGDPGWITIWRGWDKLCLMLRGAETSHEPALSP